MNTITEKVLGIKEKCVVEIFYLYDCRYAVVSCNGKIMLSLGDEDDIFAELIKRKFVKKVCALAQCSDEGIIFTHVNFEAHAKDKVGLRGYESSDYIDGEYDVLVSFCEEYGYPKADDFDVLAKGITEIENFI